MLKAIKIRIYPSDEQKQFINKQLGCCRVVYNSCLAYRRDKYEKEGISITSSQSINYIVELKKEREWLKEVHSKVLQQSVMDMNSSYKNFFEGRCGFPKFKSKKDYEQKCRFPKDAFIGIRGNRIDLIKSLKDIHFKCSVRDERYLNKNQDKVHSLTLTRNKAGQYYLSVLVDKQIEPKPQTTSVIGIDLGIKDFVITSEGQIFENLHFKKSETNKLKRLQRQLSRKKEGSKNREKARIKLAKLNQKIRNKKLHYLHQVSNQLVSENQIICMEDLNVKGMMRNHNLAESIGEMNFGEFKNLLTYKYLQYGRQLVFIDRFYPSSKTCHCCGYVNKSLKLSDRQWICPECNSVIDRDLNAAQNIKDEGLRKIIGWSSPKFTPADCPTMDDKETVFPLKSSDRMKQEKNGSHKEYIKI